MILCQILEEQVTSKVAGIEGTAAATAAATIVSLQVPI
jgi:hypothetical protein